jgi:hypothetical protein
MQTPLELEEAEGVCQSYYRSPEVGIHLDRIRSERAAEVHLDVLRQGPPPIFAHSSKRQDPSDRSPLPVMVPELVSGDCRGRRSRLAAICLTNSLGIRLLHPLQKQRRRVFFVYH